MYTNMNVTCRLFLVLCVQMSSHMHRDTHSIKIVIYAFYQQFPSTLKISSAHCIILSELHQASKDDSVTNSARRNAHDSAAKASDFTNLKNNHHDKSEEFRLRFWKGKEKRDSEEVNQRMKLVTFANPSVGISK